MGVCVPYTDEPKRLAVGRAKCRGWRQTYVATAPVHTRHAAHAFLFSAALMAPSTLTVYPVPGRMDANGDPPRQTRRLAAPTRRTDASTQQQKPLARPAHLLWPVPTGSRAHAVLSILDAPSAPLPAPECCQTRQPDVHHISAV